MPTHNILKGKEMLWTKTSKKILTPTPPHPQAISLKDCDFPPFLFIHFITFALLAMKINWDVFSFYCITQILQKINILF